VSESTLKTTLMYGVYLLDVNPLEDQVKCLYKFRVFMPVNKSNQFCYCFSKP